MGVGNGAVFQLVPQRYPACVGTMTGLVGAAGGVGGFLLPLGLGALRGATGTFALGFAGLALAALAVGAGASARRRAWRTAGDLEMAL